MISALLCSIIGFVFIDLLCQSYEAFEWWPSLVRKVIGDKGCVVDFDTMKWWQLLIYKPLSGCAKCMAGWLSAIYFLLEMPFNLFSFISFVSLAIFGAWLLAALREKFNLE